MKQAIVYWKTLKAGILTESDEGYSFAYDKDYLSTSEAQPISLTMPLRQEVFLSSTLHPFFDGLIPEGWLLDIAQKNWNLLKTCNASFLQLKKQINTRNNPRNKRIFLIILAE